MKLQSRNTKRPKSCWSVVSETYRDFAENTSIHGLKYTVKKEIGPWEKMFWILVITFGLCGSIYMTGLFWRRYLSDPTRTTILTSYAPTTSLPFPAVTICNINIIILSKVEEFMNSLSFNESEKSNIRRALPQLLAFTYPNAREYNMTELNLLQQVLEANGYNDVTSVMEAVSQNCIEMLASCLWNKKKISCRENFRKSFSEDGVCCSFNYPSSEKQHILYSSFSGLGTSLKVQLNPIIEDVQYSALYSSGFKIIIHDPFEYPGPQSNSKISTVGKMSYIQIMGTKMTCTDDVKNLPVSQRYCLLPDEFNLKYFGSEYSFSNCLLECDERMYFNICNCVPYYFSFSDKAKCNISKIPCLHDVLSNKAVYLKGHKCECVIQCEDVFYNILSTSARIMYNESISLLLFDHQRITMKTILLNIFFLGDTQTILQRDTITSTIYLLSSFGGVYSLFMGCSLITGAEIIYFCVFRLMVNMKLIGKVKSNPDYAKEVRKMQKGHYTFKPYHNYQMHQFYYHDSFLP